MNFLRLARRPLMVALVAVVAGLFVVDVASACPSCKQALASDGGDRIAGYFWSILFMMSMPFTLLGGFSTYMYLLVRRARASAVAAGSPHVADESASPGSELNEV